GPAAHTYPNALYWETVDQIAMDQFPTQMILSNGVWYPVGGMLWVTYFNNNPSAVPALPADGTTATISNNITLVGPGNYYVHSINMSGSHKITFDNRNGPVNLWLGPDAAVGSTFK